MPHFDKPAIKRETDAAEGKLKKTDKRIKKKDED